MDKVDISVIVPVYNARRRLEQCLASLAGQDYPSFEVLLVEDGSTDGSGAICRQWAERDPRFRLLHQPRNGGVSAARNAGLAAAQGRYITFCDSDDQVEPGYLSALMAAGEESLVVTGIYNLWQDGARTPRQQYPAQVRPMDGAGVCAMLEQGAFNYVYAKRYERARLVAGGIAFAPDLSLGEDTLFVAEYARLCPQVCFVPGLHYGYHQGAEGTLSGFRRGYVSQLEQANARVLAALTPCCPNLRQSEAWQRRMWSLFYYALFAAARSDWSVGEKLEQIRHVMGREDYRQMVRQRDGVLAGYAPAERAVLRMGSGWLLLALTAWTDRRKTREHQR